MNVLEMKCLKSLLECHEWIVRSEEVHRRPGIKMELAS